MSTNLKGLRGFALRAAVAAAAAPALLSFGARTAQADVVVTWDDQPWGTTAHIRDISGQDSTCTYTATPEGSFLPPFSSPQFSLQAHHTYDLLIQGIPTGTTWGIRVHCDPGGNYPCHGERVMTAVPSCGP